MLLNNVRQFLSLGPEASSDEVLKSFKSLVLSQKREVGMMLEDEEKQFAAENEDAMKEAEETPMDHAAMKAVLGLKSDATDEEYVSALKQVLTGLETEKAAEEEAMTPMGMPAKHLNYSSLGTAVQSAKSSRTPTNQQSMYQTKSAPAFHKSRFVFHQLVVDAIKHSRGSDLKSFKAQNYEIGPLGGFTLRPDVVAEEILPMLREASIIDRLGVVLTEVPDNASYIRNRMVSAPTAYWFHANNGPTDSDSTFEPIQATPMGLGARTLIPRYMIDKSPASVEEQIRREIVQSIKLKRDLSMFTGTGTRRGTDLAREPLGLDFIPNVHQYPITGTGVGQPDDYIEAKGHSRRRKRSAL
ncbi:MAG: phage major capsid protein [Candidatus Competibacteraceae bacterium]|nr:phage major capsid protein [Candidatus Competibacteraceae bacterium]